MIERCPECASGGHGDLGECIQSTNKPNPTHGYAPKRVDGVRDYEHRIAYREARGEIPDGMVLDHICHDPATCPSPNKNCPHRSCVNPWHLEPKSRGDNIARGYNINAAKTHCMNGHPFDDDNTYVNPSTGSRVCRVCYREYLREWKRKNRR